MKLILIGHWEKVVGLIIISLQTLKLYNRIILVNGQNMASCMRAAMNFQQQSGLCCHLKECLTINFSAVWMVLLP